MAAPLKLPVRMMVRKTRRSASSILSNMDMNYFHSEDES
jgi:hypothetical protein